MLATTRTFTLEGILARPVRVEVDVHRGLPGFAIVGLPDTAVREARERVRAALVNCGFEFPLRRIVVNLAPASLRKAGPGMDLAIAAGLLSASGQLDWPGIEQVALVGELGLDGRVRPVLGALAIAEAAREDGKRQIVLPADNGPEAALAGGVEVVPLADLAELPAVAAGKRAPSAVPLPLRIGPSPHAPDLADLRGQPHLRRTLEVAAAGGHSLLMVGPPGAGKSLAASRVPSILPSLAEAEALEVARIAGATGRLSAGSPAERPFRAPHHTISAGGMIGGGTPSRPGEITLAHRGVLFLDQLCEFRRDVLEALRAPLETGEVAIARAGRVERLPSRFMLVAASDPCPCGRGEEDPDCTCMPAQVERYHGRVHGALADRIDLLVVVAQPSAAEIGGAPGETSATVRDRVRAARERQEGRLGPGRCNAEMAQAEARRCRLRRDGREALVDLRADGLVDGDGEIRLLRVARTLADLAGSDAASAEQIAAASELCGVPRRIWRPVVPMGAASADPGTPARARRAGPLPRPAGPRTRRYMMELRCPDCLSPEVTPPRDGTAGRLRCDNCGEQFEREEAFVTVGDAERHVPAPTQEELFDLDVALARAELDPNGAIKVVNPHSDADELHGLVDAAQDKDVIRARREGAAIAVYPYSVAEPDPLLGVHPGHGLTLLGSGLNLRWHDDEDPVAFTIRVLEEMVGEANSLVGSQAADGERLDRIAAFLNRPGRWNGADVCEFLATEIVASGRRLRDDDR